MLFAQSFFVATAFWAWTSEVKDNVDKGYVKAIRINGIETEVRVDIKGARGGLTIWQSSKALGLLIQEPQLLQNISVGP